MNTLSFVWTGQTSLATELGKPLKEISVEFEPHGWPMFATLWRQDGTGLRLFSQMHDVAERREVGVLQFEYVSSPKNNESSVDIAATFNCRITPYKLVVHESGVSAESGVVLTANDGTEIVIVASSNPYFLAVGGILSVPHIFEPEYPIDRYKRVPIT
jgi:hypothetical protein